MQENENTHFSKNQYLSAYPDGIENHYWYLSRNWQIKKMLNNMNDTGVILEIGCGRGIVVSYLRKKGFECFGCDTASLNPITAGVAKYLFANQDAFELKKNIRNSVKTILLLDVLEHIFDAKEFLKKIEKTFPNLEYIIVTVPARKELWSNYDEHYGHFKRYNLKELANEFSGMNVKSLKIGYLYRSLYIAGLLFVKMFKTRDIKVFAPRNFLGRSIHFAVAAALYMENTVLPKFFCGSSAYIILNKKRG